MSRPGGGKGVEPAIRRSRLRPPVPAIVLVRMFTQVPAGAGASEVRLSPDGIGPDPTMRGVPAAVLGGCPHHEPGRSSSTKINSQTAPFNMQRM